MARTYGIYLVCVCVCYLCGECGVYMVCQCFVGAVCVLLCCLQVSHMRCDCSISARYAPRRTYVRVWSFYGMCVLYVVHVWFCGVAYGWSLGSVSVVCVVCVVSVLHRCMDVWVDSHCRCGVCVVQVRCVRYKFGMYVVYIWSVFVCYTCVRCVYVWYVY